MTKPILGKILIYTSVIIFQVIVVFYITYFFLNKNSVTTEVIEEKTVVQDLENKGLQTYSSERFGYEFSHPYRLSINDSVGDDYYNYNSFSLTMSLDYQKSTCQPNISLKKIPKNLLTYFQDFRNQEVEDVEMIEKEGYTELSYKYQYTNNSYYSGISFYKEARLYEHYKNFDKYYIELSLNFSEEGEKCLRNGEYFYTLDDYRDVYQIIADSLKLFPDNPEVLDIANWTLYRIDNLDLTFKYPGGSEHGLSRWFIGTVRGKDQYSGTMPQNSTRLPVCPMNGSNCMYFVTMDQDKTFDDYIAELKTNNYIDTGIGQIELSSIEELDIAGVQAYKIVGNTESQTVGAFDKIAGYNKIYILIGHKDKTIIITYFDKNSTYNKIVETIEFN